MAECKIESVVVETTDRYILTLTKQEAEFLHRLLGHHIYGMTNNRILSSGIFQALERHFDYDLGALPCVRGMDRVCLDYEGDE